MVNKVILLGRLGSDPELKRTQTGQSVVNLNLATTERWNDKSGSKQEKTEWHRVVVWGTQAELSAQYLHKGSKVFVEGSIQTREYESNGSKKHITEIRARSVQFLNELQGANRENAKAVVNQIQQSLSQEPSFNEQDVPF